MAEPIASRPYMPGYGLHDAAKGTGLLPWSWGVWVDDALWFSSSRVSRKARNLAANAHCTITTDNAYEPVVIEGEASLIDDLAAIGAFVTELNRKYKTDYSVDFFNPTDNACFRVRPAWAFGLTEADFTGTPTRWTFPADGGTR
jgi:hypothetical protein